MEAGDVETQEGCCRLRAAGGHDDRGRNSRTQTLLSICQRQRESSTSARERCSTRRFGVCELGVVDPLFAILRRHSRTCSGSRTSVISSRKSDMSLYPTFIHQRIKSRSRHSTEKKVNTTVGRSCNFTTSTLNPETYRRIEAV